MTMRCVIVNPRAGRGRAAQRLADLHQALDAAGLACDVWQTHARGEAAVLTRRALELEYDQVAVMGGDGTLHEVVNALMESTQRGGPGVALGVVPLGTGNDFVKSLDGVQTDDLAGAVQRLARGQTRTIDVGAMTVNTSFGVQRSYFLNDVGIGIHAHVAAYSNRVRWFRGRGVYAIATVQALIWYAAVRLRVTCGDVAKDQPFFLMSVGNGRCQGAGFWLTPHAELDDGLLDVCLIDEVSLFTILRFMPRVWRGEHTDLPPVTMGRSERLTVAADDVPFLLSADGEIISDDAWQVAMQAVPGALALLV